MRNRIIIAGIWWAMILAAFVVAGCGNEGISAQGPAPGRAGNGDILRDGIRIRRDEARNRIWLLGLDDVRVYDSVNRRLIRKIVLPNWSVARFICEPDMALDSSGSAVISSNVQPKLWRIEADSFEVKQHEISLLGRERWDVGFGALALSADGTLYALTSSAGLSWKIDVARASAAMIEPNNPASNACAFSSQFMKDIERSR